MYKNGRKNNCVIDQHIVRTSISHRKTWMWNHIVKSYYHDILQKNVGNFKEFCLEVIDYIKVEICSNVWVGLNNVERKEGNQTEGWVGELVVGKVYDTAGGGGIVTIGELRGWVKKIKPNSQYRKYSIPPTHSA